MDFDDLVTLLPPAAKRVGKHTGEHEQHLYEGAVMVAYAMHLLRFEGAQEVEIHPDGMHGTQFDFTACLARRNFTMTTPTGRTAYGGIYADGTRTVVVNPTSGRGDVVARIGNQTVLAETKGGVINTRHGGQVSKLRRGLCEAVGLLMSVERAGRQVAVVPYADVTLRIAEKMLPRCRHAGIEIALVRSRGEVSYVT
jgi:hypothetical protein